ncbi:MAG: hypothetical protein PWQ88_272 [Candidatus Methanomethylophilaceae archaeon]|nr:MAG: Redox-active disulfide protein 2 [Methanomicrobiales archaeon 53_19]MDI3482401.1 hypothetical protein [Candidatus Methanomethylophilaceae archaeon]MDI3542044.1 hypothetical protein [Candidatus Methanomethylophilaceae archaeon]HIJ00773.1 thioredoxin family protein [Candidatus Methanomethylophilaceae archaeon]
MIIEIFGSGCSKCKRLERNTRDALKELGIDAELRKVEDYDEMVDRGIIMTPTLTINGKTYVSGRVATIKEIKKILQDLS